jgi:hypothetical protein
VHKILTCDIDSCLELTGADDLAAFSGADRHGYNSLALRSLRARSDALKPEGARGRRGSPSPVSSVAASTSKDRRSSPSLHVAWSASLLVFSRSSESIEVQWAPQSGPQSTTPRARQRDCGRQTERIQASVVSFPFSFFLLQNFISYLYDSRTPGYAVAHPAYPVGPPLSLTIPCLSLGIIHWDYTTHSVTASTLNSHQSHVTSIFSMPPIHIREEG